MRTPICLLALGVAAGCGGSGGGGFQAMVDFLLEDVNPNSTTFMQMVSPRDQLGGVSCWYFAHAT